MRTGYHKNTVPPHAFSFCSATFFRRPSAPARQGQGAGKPEPPTVAMSLNVARSIRVFAAAALPVPLFVVSFCFSYLHLSYHGYDFENGTYFTNPMSLSNCRHCAWESLWIFLVMGYVIMCVPSFLYSFSLEFYRGKPSASYAGYVTLGGALGGLASILLIWLNPGCLVEGYWDIVTAYLLSAFIGAGIAAFLSRIGPPKLKTGADSLRGESVA